MLSTALSRGPDRRPRCIGDHGQSLRGWRAVAGRETATWRDAHQQDVAQQEREGRAKAKKSAGGRRGLEGGPRLERNHGDQDPARPQAEDP